MMCQNFFICPKWANSTGYCNSSLSFYVWLFLGVLNGSIARDSPIPESFFELILTILDMTF
jgi:hypothetical protein